MYCRCLSGQLLQLCGMVIVEIFDINDNVFPVKTVEGGTETLSCGHGGFLLKAQNILTVYHTFVGKTTIFPKKGEEYRKNLAVSSLQIGGSLL